ncbi:hypothetical protein DPMN_055995 [Dreissena polymorpha]|uniref:Uncharacterized protein n=1 Tax=Dreissena polymorpha TaxID=45954 RepID=A0A9D4HR41_DREPO|nr:hypothetical protein DPMN_055995 [Dreissena polymorpha]
MARVKECILLFSGLMVTICSIKGDEACQWPSEFRATAVRSSRGYIWFWQTTMNGWPVYPQGPAGTNVSAWECLSAANFATDGTLIMRMQTPVKLISTNYYAYMCITLSQVTTFSYQFYIRNDPNPNLGFERLYLSIAKNEKDPSNICNITHGASGGEYNLLVRLGNGSSTQVTCPFTFLGRSGYSYVSSNGSVTCDAGTSDLKVCLYPK